MSDQAKNETGKRSKHRDNKCNDIVNDLKDCKEERLMRKIILNFVFHRFVKVKYNPENGRSEQ